MKTISLIGIAVALCVPALASARPVARAGTVDFPARMLDVRRIEGTRAITPVRDFEIARRGDAARGETGTRIPRARPDDPNRRRRPHHPNRRRWFNAHNPPGGR